MESVGKVLGIKIVEGTTEAPSSQKSIRPVGFLSFFRLFFHEKKAKEMIEYIKPPKYASAETRMIRFMVNGKENQYVDDVIDLTQISEECLISFRRLLSEVKLDKFASAFFALTIRELTTLSPLRHTLPFVLAEMAKRTDMTSVNYIAKDALKRPEEFMLFVKYYAETDPFILDEHFQMFIEKWYVKMEPSELVQLICEKPILYRYSHGDAMKLGLFKFAPLPVKIVREYAINGLETVTSIYGKQPEASLILECFREVEKIRQTTDPEHARRQINFHHHQLSNVNAEVLKHKTVMKALLRRMPLRQLLDILPFMEEQGFFQRDDLFTRRVHDKLVDSSEIEHSNLQPSESYVLQQKLLFRDVPAEILSALEKQMEKALSNVPEIEVDNITVVINCFRLNDEGQAPKAAAVLALSLKKAGRNVKIQTFEGPKLKEMREATIATLASSIAAKSRCDSLNFLKDLAEKSTGTIIIIGHSTSLSDFKEKNAKVKIVFCDLCGGQRNILKDDDNTLVTIGFNKNTCEMIFSYLVLSKFV